MVGEAKRKKAIRGDMIYHHTSSARSYLIWQSGSVAIEGIVSTVPHPVFSEIRSLGLQSRRAGLDFPPLTWFTSDVSVPNCLAAGISISQTGNPDLDSLLSGLSRQDLENVIALHRMALGFRASEIGAMPWPNHPGYETKEGEELNESARCVGDNPDLWHVVENDVALSSLREFWISPSILKPRLVQNPPMVAMVKTLSGVPIGPDWASPGGIKSLSQELGIDPQTIQDKINGFMQTLK